MTCAPRTTGVGPLRPRAGAPGSTEGAPQDGAPFEVARLGDPVPVDGEGGALGPHGGGHLVGSPHVEAALLPLGVGVLGRVQPSTGGGQLGEHVADGLLDDLEPARLTTALPGVQIGANQAGLVVEHLLEVRHRPAGVGRVPGEAAPDVVVDPACRHRPQRRGGHGERPLLAGQAMMAEAQLHQLGLGELRCRPETPPGGVEARSELGHRGRQSAVAWAPGSEPSCCAARSRGRRVRRSMASAERVGLAVDLVGAGVPHVVDGVEDAAEAGHAVTVAPREVGASEEGTAVGGEEHRHRPPAAAGHGLDGLHVDGVDVGALLAIHLDRDEPGVELLGGLLVLEGLVRHDVAPVTCGVADRQEDGTVLGPGPGEGLLAPRVPVHRVVGVLAEIGTRLRGQSVHGPEPTTPAAAAAHPRCAGQWHRT